jgi:hypothetical protein
MSFSSAGPPLLERCQYRPNFSVRFVTQIDVLENLPVGLFIDTLWLLEYPRGDPETSQELKMAKDRASSSESELAAPDPAASTETADMILTYDKNTGQVIRIAHVDPSGAHKELTEEEYAAFFGYDSAEEPANDPTMEYAIAHQQAGFEQGYYHGLLEYEAALGGQTASGYSPEEESAYYQGMADYEALISQS